MAEFVVAFSGLPVWCWIASLVMGLFIGFCVGMAASDQEKVRTRTTKE